MLREMDELKEKVQFSKELGGVDELKEGPTLRKRMR
jgi:hypothetical protein